jgi:hypothetical protein
MGHAQSEPHEALSSSAGDTATALYRFLAATGLNRSGRSATPWSGVGHVLNELARRWVLALTAPTAVCMAVARSDTATSPGGVKD